MGTHADGDSAVSLISFRTKQTEKSCKGQEEGEWRAQVAILGSAQVLSPPPPPHTHRSHNIQNVRKGFLGIWASGDSQVGAQAYFSSKVPALFPSDVLLSILPSVPHPKLPLPYDSDQSEDLHGSVRVGLWCKQVLATRSPACADLEGDRTLSLGEQVLCTLCFFPEPSLKRLGVVRPIMGPTAIYWVLPTHLPPALPVESQE